MSNEDFAKMARPFAGELPDYLEQSWAHLASLLKTRIQRLGDLPQEIAFLCEQPAFDAEALRQQAQQGHARKGS